MKKFSLLHFIFLIAINAITSTVAFGQPEPPPEGTQFVENRRPNLLQSLGLNKDQIRQIRQLNQTFQPQKQDAQRRFNQANKALDEAVYADDVNESIIKDRLNEVQLAHAELIKTRTMMDTSIRKVLTREQLVKFRQLRKQFMQNQKNPDKPLQNRPLRKRMERQGNRPSV